MANCRRLLEQAAARPASFARIKAGNNRAARMVIMAITTSNSIRVNARGLRPILPKQARRMTCEG
jgi:hypothetical protein